PATHLLAEVLEAAASEIQREVLAAQPLDEHDELLRAPADRELDRRQGEPLLCRIRQLAFRRLGPGWGLGAQAARRRGYPARQRPEKLRIKALRLVGDAALARVLEVQRLAEGDRLAGQRGIGGLQHPPLIGRPETEVLVAVEPPRLDER